MKAIVYGPSSTLQLGEIDKPAPRADEVLIRVRAASVNPLDNHLLKTAPFVRNMMFRMMGVRTPRPGADVAGEVEAIGRNVTRFEPGDDVFGASGGGAFAEYACSPEPKLARKPPGISFEAAASANVAGCTAYQGLREVQSGKRVLINGASGGVGTFAVQIAKWMGADVTAVCGTQNVEMVRQLGADRVIDYTHEDFVNSGVQYDVIFDLVGNKPLLAIKRVLTPHGRYIGAGVLGSEASIIRMLPGMLSASILSLFTEQKFASFMAKVNKDDLTALAGLMETGKIKPVIDRTYTLDETPEAVRYVAAKHARGKVVISVGPLIGTGTLPPAGADGVPARSERKFSAY